MNKIKKRFDYLFERMSKADKSLNKPLFYEELDKVIEEAKEEEREKIIQLANNLMVNVSKDVDTRTMAYRQYLLKRGFNDGLHKLINCLEGKEKLEFSDYWREDKNE